MPFKKGKSGNPAGRKKGTLKGSNQAKQWADSKGFNFLIKIAEGKEPGSENNLKLRSEIATYLVDRAYGRPGQSVTATDAEGIPLEFTLKFNGK